MKINAILTALKARLEAASKDALTGDLRRFNVEVSRGRFDASELMRESFHAPAIRLAFLGGPRSRAAANGQRQYDAAFAAFIVTDMSERAVAGADLMEWVAAEIELWRPDLPGVQIPKDQRLEALYSGDIDKRGVALHAVAWAMVVRIGHDEIGAGPHDPTALAPQGDPDALDFAILPTDLPEGI